MIIEANRSQEGGSKLKPKANFPLVQTFVKFDRQKIKIIFDLDRCKILMNIAEFCKTVVSLYVGQAVFDIFCIVIKYALLAVFINLGKTPAEVRLCRTGHITQNHAPDTSFISFRNYPKICLGV